MQSSKIDQVKKIQDGGRLKCFCIEGSSWKLSTEIFIIICERLTVSRQPSASLLDEMLELFHKISNYLGFCCFLRLYS